MSADQNLATIKNVYDAFTRGDAETILAALSDDVDWGTDAASAVAPWYGTRHGKAEVGKFFGDIGGAIQVLDFTPLGFGTSDNEVFALLRFASRNLTTGREVAMNLHHYFRFDADGKIEYWRGSEDTAQTAASLVA